MFARVYRENNDELRADFQQYYNLNLDKIGYEYSIRHAASLVTQLPSGCRLFTSLDKSTAWGLPEYQLADIANSLRWLVWAQSKDGQKNRNKPQMMKPPEAMASLQEAVVSIDEYIQISKRQRKEV